jgi:hypothetical protein
MSSSGTENLHRRRIINGNTHIADEHGSIRWETRRKIPPFATEFATAKSQRTSAGIPVSGKSGVLQNRHIPRLSDRRAGAVGGNGHVARASSSCLYVGFLLRCYSDPFYSEIIGIAVGQNGKLLSVLEDATIRSIAGAAVPGS